MLIVLIINVNSKQKCDVGDDVGSFTLRLIDLKPTLMWDTSKVSIIF